MGFLKNRKKTFTQPVLHAENAKTQTLQQTEGKTSQVNICGNTAQLLTRPLQGAEKPLRGTSQGWGQ